MQEDPRPQLKDKILKLIETEFNKKINKTNIGKAAKLIRENCGDEGKQIFDDIITEVKKAIYHEHGLDTETKPTNGGGEKKGNNSQVHKKPNSKTPTQEEVLRVASWFMSQLGTLKHET